VWWEMSGRGHFSPADPVTAGLLLASGPLTAIPLLMFGAGARVLRFTTIGLMQYITPTMIFVLAVTVFDEPFDRVRALTFALIWTALAIYTGSVLRARQQGRA
jgi:chloramphenicol-sensitive protein RarD